MLQQERHEQILARLNTDGKVKVKELAVDFEVTEDCIRKDLTALEKEGLLKRIHGGAMQVRKNLHAYHVDERMSVRLTQKKPNTQYLPAKIQSLLKFVYNFQKQLLPHRLL